MFLDRDCTIAEEVGHLNHLDRFRMFPFAPEAIRRLNEAGVPAVVVTNQSGVARGYFLESLVHEVHERLKRELAQAGARLDARYCCPHGSAVRCVCRKPRPGMLQRADEGLNLDLQSSFVVGDRYTDMEPAFNGGARAAMVRTGYGPGERAWRAQKWQRQPDCGTENLQTAVDWILRENR